MTPHTTASRSSTINSRVRLGFAFCLALFSLITNVASLRAADMTWDNGATTSNWNTSDVNWSGSLWNNANGDGAIFGATGAGPISVTGPMNVNSLSFTVNGYTLGGSGPLTFVSGSSTQGTGNINVNTNRSAEIDTQINSSLGLQKQGGGTLTVGGALNFSGNGVVLGGGGNLFGDLVVGGSFNGSYTSGGKITIAGPGVVPTNTRLGVVNGLFDIGSNNVTLSQLTFVNQGDTAALPWNNGTGTGSAGAAVISTGGAGTLHVTGEINVLGQQTGAGGNSIGANLDLGGGTQVIRVGQNGSIGYIALQISGVISDGSLLKSYGYLAGSTTQASPDGMALYGNNTYTGSTILNAGTNIMTGTNATTSAKIAGPGGGLSGSTLTLQGANGSLLSATTIEAETGGTFSIDNTAATSGTNQPTIAAAQNNNRIADNAEIQLLNGGFTYKGLASTAATETFGNLNSINGANTVTITPGAGGSVALTASGNLSMGSRSTLALATAAGTLGGTAQLFVGTAPTTDAAGLVSRVYTGTSASNPTDFVTYNAGTGFNTYTGYSSTFAAGTAVSNGGAQAVATSVSVDAIKSTGTGTTTITAGQTLGVTSGMLLSAGFGSRTYASSSSSTSLATLDFGSAAGVSFGTNILGTATNPLAITGSAGIINSVGTLTLGANDDLSGLTGEITSNGTTNLNNDTFGGTIQVRNGSFNINASQTHGGAITIGTPENDSNLIGLAPNVSLSGAPANSTMARDIIFNNGALTAAGAAVKTTFQPSFTVLGNTTANGTQTISGNIILDSPGLVNGGSPNTTTGLGSTNFTGNVSGPSTLQLSSDRANFSGNISNAGIIIGATTGSASGTQVTFSGTTTGSVPIFLEPGNSGGTAVGTQLRYNSGSLPTGPITVENFLTSGGTAAQILPLQNSTINNSIILNAALVGNVGSGISANWNGQMSGSSNFTKSGTGTLTLGNAANTYTGTTTVSAGTLLVNGANASSSTTVQSGGTLGGMGILAHAVTVSAGGTIAPGNSSTLSTGTLSLSGTYLAGLNLNNGGPASADLLNVTGNVSLTGGSLVLSLTNVPSDDTGPLTFLVVQNDAGDGVTGTFSSVTGNFQSVTVDYGFTGTDALGRVGDGNDIAVTVVAVPEPTTFAMLGLGAVLLLLNLRRRAALNR